jgi:hypothetical protein
MPCIISNRLNMKGYICILFAAGEAMAVPEAGLAEYQGVC